ncbi:MAG: hypothetical protein K0S36_209 [Nitrosospira multiformis]|jgi:hypothetical protein|nr:hypothetical protein [Nitrosospira multiformis]
MGFLCPVVVLHRPYIGEMGIVRVLLGGSAREGKGVMTGLKAIDNSKL